MAQYGACFSGGNVYLDFTDSMTKRYQNVLQEVKGYKKLLCWEEYLKHRFYEPYVANKYGKIIMCSKSDRDYLVQLGVKKKHFIVLENGVISEDWPFWGNIIKRSEIRLVFW